MSDNKNEDPETSEENDDHGFKKPDFKDDVSKKARDVADTVLNSTPVKFIKGVSWVTGLTPAFKLASWGIKRKGAAMKIITPLFAAAALVGYLGVGWYASGLAYVKFNDTTSFLNWPATQGQWKGNVTRFSEKGTWPCNAYEGNLRTGEAADSEPFAVRKWNTELIDAIQNVPTNTDVTLVYRDNGIEQEDFDTSVWKGCHQHSDHTAVGIKYGDISVGIHPH